MRHRARSRKLGRTSAHRLSLYRNMVTSLLDVERIQTTDAKAKEVRRLAERMITLGKRGDLHARRRALRIIRSRAVAAKVFDDLAERYRDRPGGYTRVLKLRNRVGDAAPVSIVELVEPAASAAAEPAAGRKKAGRARKKAAASAGEEAAPKKKAAPKKAPAAGKKVGGKASTGKAAARKTGKKTGAKASGSKAGSKKTASASSKKKSSKKSD